MAKCSVCSRDDAGLIDDKLAAGVPYKRITEEHPPLTAMALSRHRKAHLTPGLVALQQKVNGGIGNAARVENLYQRAEQVLASAEDKGEGSLSLQAIRELRNIVELLCRLTGELDERPTLQVLNVQASPEWAEVRTRLFHALGPFPDAQVAVAAALGPSSGVLV